MNKNLILSLSLFETMICSPTVSAITADDYKLKMDSVLEAVDLSLIDSGILEDGELCQFRRSSDALQRSLRFANQWKSIAIDVAIQR